MAAPILILVASLAHITLLTQTVQLAIGGGWRRSFLRASVLNGTLVIGLSEGLGAFGALNTQALALAWILVTVMEGLLYLKLRAGREPGAARPEGSPGIAPVSEWSVGFRWCLIFIVLQAGILAIVAWAAAPNTWDSMTYHLSRVMHWQQNKSLDFYPTAIQRQLAFGPWAEMAILQFQILTNGDRLANFVQYFALLGCGIGASYVACRLGAEKRGQAFAALAVITLPMAVLQSTSTQNDLVGAFWCMVALGLALEDDSREKPISRSAWLGAALGLASLTKTTALVFLTPLMAWYTWRLLRRLRARSLTPLALGLIVAVLLQLPHARRNTELYGNPLGMASGTELDGYTNEIIGLRPLLSNSIRTVGLQLATPSETANDALERVVRELHYAIGISPDDPLTTWRQARFDIVFSMYEDNAANPAHVLLMLAGIVLLLRDRTRALCSAWLCWLIALLLFFLIVKWQPWNSRLILPALAWGAALAAVQVARRLRGDTLFLPGVLLAAIAVPYMLANPTRPLIGARSVLNVDRTHQYFANVPDDYRTYAQAAAALRGAGCREIGLAAGSETREYLLWVTSRAIDPGIRIEHVLVKNPSRRYAADFRPCAVVVAYPYDESTISLNGTTYAEALKTERFHLFLKFEQTP